MSPEELNDESADAGTEPAPASEATHAPASESDATSAPAGDVESSDERETAPEETPVEAAAAPEVDESAAAAEEPAAAPEKPAPKPAAPNHEAKKPAAPRRKRGAAREEGVPVPVVRAQAKYVRSSARKARLVCDNIRGKTVEEARAILAHTPRAVARDWSKLLESAVANAEHNHELVGEDLYVKAVTADEGPTIKRFRPRAMGRATKIRKRTAHLTILLTPKD
jgi:ribosomal protein L22